MSNQYINFYYDPARQGFDTEAWSLIQGPTPAVNFGYLALNNLTAISHYGDCVRGDFIFKLNIPAIPKLGDNRVFGLYQVNRGAGITFSLSGGTFSANTNDGYGNTYSSAITWQSAWTGTLIDYRIRWEAGTAKFYINGGLQVAITDESVSGDALSMYLSNGNADSILLNHIQAKGIQSYYLNTPLVGSQTFGKNIAVFDTPLITESTAFAISLVTPPSFIVDSATISDVVTTPYFKIYDTGLLTDVLTGTELVTTGYGPGLIPGKSVVDTLTISESLTIFSSARQMYEQIVLSELVTVTMQ